MFEGIDKIDWFALETAYGGAADVPDQLKRLVSDSKTVRNLVKWELYGNLYHQGTIYEAAGYAIPYLFEIAKNRAEEKEWILKYIADLLVGDGDYLAPFGMDYRLLQENNWDNELKRMDEIDKEIPFLLENMKDKDSFRLYDMSDFLIHFNNSNYSEDIAEVFIEKIKKMDSNCVESQISLLIGMGNLVKYKELINPIKQKVINILDKFVESDDILIKSASLCGLFIAQQGKVSNEVVSKIQELVEMDAENFSDDIRYWNYTLNDLLKVTMNHARPGTPRSLFPYLLDELNKLERSSYIGKDWCLQNIFETIMTYFFPNGFIEDIQLENQEDKSIIEQFFKLLDGILPKFQKSFQSINDMVEKYGLSSKYPLQSVKKYPNHAKHTEMPDLNKYKIAKMVPTREEAEEEKKKLMEQGYWDIHIVNPLNVGLFGNPYSVMIPKDGPRPKPETLDKAQLMELPKKKLFEKYLLSMGKGDTVTSTLVLEVLKEKGELDALVISELVSNYMNNRQGKKAIELLSDIIQTDSNNPFLHEIYGDVKHSLKQLWGSIEEYKIALELKPNRIELYSKLGSTYFMMGDYENSLKMYQEILDTPKVTEGVYCWVFNLLIIQDKLREALDFFIDLEDEKFQTSQLDLRKFKALFGKMHLTLIQHVSHTLGYQNSYESKINKVFDLLLEDLEKTETESERLGLLELIFFVFIVMNVKKIDNIKEFSDSKEFFAFMDKLIGKTMKYWLILNDWGWALEKGPTYVYKNNNIEPRQIAEYLIQKGESTENIEMECYGKDFLALILSKSNEKEDLIRAKNLLEAISKVSKDYYTPDTLSLVNKKLQH